MKQLNLLLLAVVMLSGCAVLRPALKDPATDPRTFIGETPIKWKTIGRSVQNRPIYYATFGNGDDLTLLFGAFHGNERVSPHMPLYLAKLLSEQPDLIAPDAD